MASCWHVSEGAATRTERAQVNKGHSGARREARAACSDGHLSLGDARAVWLQVAPAGPVPRAAGSRRPGRSALPGAAGALSPSHSEHCRASLISLTGDEVTCGFFWPVCGTFFSRKEVFNSNVYVLDLE